MYYQMLLRLITPSCTLLAAIQSWEQLWLREESADSMLTRVWWHSMFLVVECEIVYFPVEWPNVVQGLRMSGDAQVLAHASMKQLFTKQAEQANNFCVRPGEWLVCEITHEKQWFVMNHVHVKLIYCPMQCCQGHWMGYSGFMMTECELLLFWSKRNDHQGGKKFVTFDCKQWSWL